LNSRAGVKVGEETNEKRPEEGAFVGQRLCKESGSKNRLKSLTCLTCLTPHSSATPLLPLAGARGRGMRVVTAQHQAQQHLTRPSRSLIQAQLPFSRWREQGAGGWGWWPRNGCNDRDTGRSPMLRGV